MKLYRKQIATTIVSIAALGGCATASKDVSTVYVSPIQYQNYNCEQLTAESLRVSGRASQLAGRLDEANSNDKSITGVGLILFWPALFALGGTKTQEAEYARLKGEYDAVSQTAIAKNCLNASTHPVPNQSAPAVAAASSAVSNSASPGTSDAQLEKPDLESKLRSLKKLHQDGLITTDVYQERQKYLLTQ